MELFEFGFHWLYKIVLQKAFLSVVGMDYPDVFDLLCCKKKKYSVDVTEVVTYTSGPQLSLQ